MSHTQNVLVIDDDPAVLNSIEKQLSSLSMNFDFTANPVIGLQKLTLHHYDLVVCDIRMEPVSGLYVLQQIKLNHPDVPVIILTGYVDDQLYEQARELQAKSYLIKPIRKAALVRAITEALSPTGE
ncbi:MAG: response regulator [Spirochaeta sp.]